MKKDYIFMLLLLCMSFSYGQDNVVATPQKDTLSKTQEIKGFEIYPNPVVDGILRINTFENAERSIYIYDVLGKQVLFRTTKKPLISVATLKSGVYILRVYERGNTATRKLIIK